MVRRADPPTAQEVPGSVLAERARLCRCFIFLASRRTSRAVGNFSFGDVFFGRLIQALDKHRRGHKQTVEVRHVHIHSGAQGVVGIINTGKEGSAGPEGEK
jgi:hypothetical protein